MPALTCSRRLLCGTESNNLAHHALSLIRFKKGLRVRGTIEDDQLFGFGSIFVISANLRQTWSICACIVARYNEERATLELLGGTVGVGAQEYDAINLPRLRGNRCVASSSPSRADANDRNSLCSRQ